MILNARLAAKTPMSN